MGKSTAEYIADNLMNPIFYGPHNSIDTIVQIFVKPLMKETYIWFKIKSKTDDPDLIDNCNDVINYSKKAFKYYLKHRYLFEKRT